MSLKEYAKSELELNGLFDKDSDYNGLIGKAVMELIEVFSKQGHSGMSAAATLYIFDQLARFKPLGHFTPSLEQAIEYAPGEWQSTRRHDVFSKDNGETWYSIDTDEKWVKPKKLVTEYVPELAQTDPTILDNIIKVSKE